MCVFTVACPNIVCHYNMLTHVVANLQTWATIRIVGGCFWCKAKALLIDCVLQFRPGMHNENVLFRNDAHLLRVVSGIPVPASNYYCGYSKYECVSTIVIICCILLQSPWGGPLHI